MPSSGSSRRLTDLVTLAFIAAATIAARLPFLLRADRFFDSDEAVEGLMARHVLLGEHPVFLWGQRYKGVPEVYFSAAVFRWLPTTSAGIVALKAVTLACFVVFVCLNFRLVTRLFNRRISLIATSLLIVCPPSFVLWSLSGSAEIVMSLLAGTVLCLGIDAWRRSGSRAGLVAAAAAFGFGLWVQQYILYYIVALATLSLDLTPHGRARLRELVTARMFPAWLRLTLGLVVTAAVFYIVLGLAAFLGLGFNVTPLGIPISVTHPQKMWRIAAALLLLSAAGLMGGRLALGHSRTTPHAWLAPAVGFLVGFSPALVGRFSSDGYGAPMARMDVAGLWSAMTPFTNVALPIVFGFKSPTTERLAVPGWAALLIAGVLVLSYRRMKQLTERMQIPLTPLFHVFLITTPIVFVISGSFIDAQSYRYLMPLYAALPVVYAVGIDRTLRSNRIAGGALLTSLLALFALQQVTWYERLEPDRDTSAIVECLDRSGIRTAYAGYWLSYKLTFLTGERVIVAPVDGVDRYAPYTATVRAQPSSPTIRRPTARPGEVVSCQGIIAPETSRPRRAP
jgi:hypothetical protein